MYERITLESPLGPRVRIGGKEYDYFCGTSYYCLHGHGRLIRAACEATRKYGLGPATGWDMPPLREVEELAAGFFGTPAAKYIVSGYLGNFFLVHALRDEYDVIFVDVVSHYSVFDAVRSVGKPVHSFPHRDPDGLGEALKRHLRPGQVPLTITDGVFPVTGAMAPLRDYAELLSPYGGILCVDDSHGVGVLGASGRGSLEHWGVEVERCYLAGTLSKAFGGFGGIIPGDGGLMERIARKVASTGPSPNSAFRIVLPSLVSCTVAVGIRCVPLVMLRNSRLKRSGMRKISSAMITSMSLSGIPHAFSSSRRAGRITC